MAEPSSSPPLWARAPRAQPPPLTGRLGRAASFFSASLRLPRRRCRPPLPLAGPAPSTRVAGMAPTADQASRFHERRPAHPPWVPAKVSRIRRADASTHASSHPTPSVWTAAPAPNSRCARTAPTASTAARATCRRPRRHILLAWCTRTTVSTPATAAALAPSSRRALSAPTASTVARASSCHRRLHGHQQGIRHPTHRRASAQPRASTPPTLIAMTAASAA